MGLGLVQTLILPRKTHYIQDTFDKYGLIPGNAILAEAVNRESSQVC